MKELSPREQLKDAKIGAGKMPHERDEVADPQVPPPEPAMKQASADLNRGLVDTDRGAAMNATYKKQKTRGR